MPTANAALVETLTSRERDFLHLLADDRSNAEISERLVLSTATVRWYVKQLYAKLGVHSREEAVKQANAVLQVPSLPPHNLPTPPTPFVGRERELAELARLLSSREVRLVTILSPGGMGKTRLAIEAAQRKLSSFLDGIYFVSLQSLSAPDLLLTAIAEAMRYRFEESPRPPLEQLCAFLRPKSMLLVLDNAEHLLEAAPLVSELLPAAPGLKCLVTSRERLNLRGESVYALGGLDYPAEGAQDLASSAAELFVHSARYVQSGFSPDDGDMTAIADICRQVDGMPLALELAARWTDLLSPAEIACEIRRDLDFLTSDVRDVPARQQSMRVIFSAAWNRLSAVERDAFMRLAVFQGEFTRDAAQVVSQASLWQLIALVDKSLVRHDPSGRYSMHAVLHQYALEKLVGYGPAEEARRRHSEYYASYLRQHIGQSAGGTSTPTCLEAIDREIENIRRGWQWAVSEGTLDLMGDYTEGLWQYFDSRGWYLGATDAIPSYRNAARRLQGLSRTGTGWIEVTARVHETLGQMLGLAGQCDDAIKHLHQALAILDQEDAPPEARCVWRARLHRQIGNLYRLQHRPGDTLCAYACAKESLGAQEADAPPDWWHEWVQIYLERSWHCYWFNQLEEYKELDTQVRVLVEQHGSLAQQVSLLNCLAVMAYRRDRFMITAATLDYARRTLEKSVAAHNPADSALSQLVLAMGLLWYGNFAQAKGLFERALATSEDNGDLVHQVRCLTYLTIIYRKEGNLDAVRHYAAQSLASSYAAHMPEYVGIAKANEAWAAWCEGDTLETARLGKAALEVWGPLDSDLAGLPWRWVALWPLMGLALQARQVSEAIAYARDILDPSQQRLPQPVTAALERAVHAWDTGHPEAAARHAQEALRLSGDFAGVKRGAVVELLTARECEVLQLIAAGLSNEEIGQRLVVSFSTVKKHINHLFAKLNVDSRTRAIVRAKELGVL